MLLSKVRDTFLVLLGLGLMVLAELVKLRLTLAVQFDLWWAESEHYTCTIHLVSVATCADVAPPCSSSFS